MERPYCPTYSKSGALQPADDIGNLEHRHAMENLRELQKYSEKLHFEATCCRLWSEGIQTQIMDEQEKIQSWRGVKSRSVYDLKLVVEGIVNMRYCLPHTAWLKVQGKRASEST